MQMGQDVEAAFELLIEAVAEVSAAIREKGAQAFRENRLADIDPLQQRAESAEGLLGKVIGIQREWLDSIAGQTDLQTDASRLTDSSDLTLPLAPIAPQADAGTHPVARLGGEIIVTMSYGGVAAKARHIPGIGHTVLAAGSTVRRQVHPSLIDKYRVDRRQCEKDGSLAVDTKNDQILLLNKDIIFDSQSGAAQFVAGCSVSGNREWRVMDTGQSLGDYLKKRRVLSNI